MNPENKHGSPAQGNFADLRRERPGLVLAIILVAFAVSAIISLMLLKKDPAEETAIILNILWTANS